MFSDGREQAYGCCAYVRWSLNNGKYADNLIVAKNRIAPQRKFTIPRLELCAAVLSAGIRAKIVQELDYEFSAVLHLVDSHRMGTDTEGKLWFPLVSPPLSKLEWARFKVKLILWNGGGFPVKTILSITTRT